MVYHIGFTGTQAGFNSYQRLNFRGLLTEHILEHGYKLIFHHGDCIGSDEDAHWIAMRWKVRVFIHPPDNDYKRAFCTGFQLRHEPKAYLQRNHDIVESTDRLIAVPKLMAEELRSGTWATIRYARKQRKPIAILWPNGVITEE